MKRGRLIVYLAVALFGVQALPVAATQFNSSNFAIDGVVGGSFSGGQASSSYKLTSVGGESIVGSASSGSYRIGEGYTSRLERSLQLSLQPNGLSAYYPIDEATGNVVYDRSASLNNGTRQAAPSWTSGKLNGALSFNGSTQYVAMNDFDISGSAITVSAWVYPTTAAQTSKVMSKQSGTTDAQGSLGLTGGNASFEATTGGTYHIATAGSALALNTWSHITGVYDGSNVLIYVNGTLANSTAGTGTLANNNLGWAAGRVSASGSSNYFTGSIDEVKVYSRALSAGQVAAEYAAGNAGNTSGLYLSVTPGASQTENYDAMVQTDAPGYSLAINQNNDLTSGGYTISPISGSIASPLTWSEGSTKGLGFTLYGSNATPIAGTWNTGSSYAALPASATTMYSRTGYTGGAKDVLNMRVRLDVAISQPEGSYTNQMTVTGTMLP
ncbi:LamG domain-containing protein [Candidatus Saccharibacteria bacterium]|nr:LamG domain-containing protein [Candidatus Saccharibacteria bacterium]